MKAFQPFVDDVHDCEWPEIQILPGDEDADGNLKAGDKVLKSCPVCGVTALEALNHLGSIADETGKAFARLMTSHPMMLFHWSPASRRQAILHDGLLPRRRATVSLGEVDGRQWRAPYICFGDTPSWAWTLSGKMRHAPTGEWDLWYVWADKLTEPMILAGDTFNGIHEVRTDHRVFKRDLWYVGTRVKR